MSDEDDLDDITPEEWAELELELLKLERSDPAVKKAAENYHKTVKKILRNKESE